MGKRSWNQKITNNDEQKILSYYKDGKTASEILDLLDNKFKTRKTIYDCLKKFNIRTRESWEYVVLDHFYFSNIDTPNKAYILGLMLSDGWIQENYNQVGIQLQEDDLCIIEKIKEEWKSNNKLIYCPKKPFKSADGTKIYYPKPLWRILVSSSKMIENLKALGIVQRKSKIVTLPLLKQFDSHMFRGIIDGDGSIYLHSNGKDICIRLLGSHYLIAQSCLYLHQKLGIDYHRPSLRGSISFVDYSSKEEVSILGKFLYSDIDKSFFIKRKYDVIKDIIN